MKVILWVLSMSFFASASLADGTNPHYTAAKRLYEATNINDTEAVVTQMVRAMITQTPQLTPAKDVLTEFIMEIVQSEEYADLKIRSYMKYLSPIELDELTSVLSSPAYQAYRVHLPEIMAVSNDGVLQIFRRRQHELRDRLMAVDSPDGDDTN